MNKRYWRYTFFYIFRSIRKGLKSCCYNALKSQKRCNNVVLIDPAAFINYLNLASSIKNRHLQAFVYLLITLYLRCLVGFRIRLWRRDIISNILEMNVNGKRRVLSEEDWMIWILQGWKLSDTITRVMNTK